MITKTRNVKHRLTAPQNALLKVIQPTAKDTRTANGAVSHKTTDTAVLDFFASGGALRGATDQVVTDKFSKAYKENKTLALKVLFYLADVRGGQGERALFRKCFNWLAKNDKVTTSSLIKHVAEFTRVDNILESLEGTPLESEGYRWLSWTLLEDMRKDAPSIAAKWAPSEQASSKTTKRLAFKLRSYMMLSPKEYRQMLSGLRKKIDVVERKMCAGEWKGINYEGVPSNASSLYRKAFKKHDDVGYTKYLGEVAKGTKTIKAATLFPYDIVRNLRASYAFADDPTLELQWKALPDYCKDNKHNGIVVADVSGSMDSGTGSVPPVDVAVSLAIYFAERNEGAFHNHFMIFSRDAKLLALRNNTSLKTKISEVLGKRDVANTDLQSVFNLILTKGIEKSVPQKDMPTVIYIVSDMQFDSSGCNYTNYETIKEKYKVAGYTLPKIVFWNVNARGDQPVKFDDKGTALVSGCSPAILKTILTGKNDTPWDQMIATITVPRYDVITA